MVVKKRAFKPSPKKPETEVVEAVEPSVAATQEEPVESQAPVSVEVEVEPEAGEQSKVAESEDIGSVPSAAAKAEDVNQPEESASPSAQEFVPSPKGVEYSSSGSAKKWFWIAVLILAVAVLVGGGIYVSQGALGGLGGAQATPSPVPTATPEASPAATLNREDIKVQVLNGTDTTGLAAKAKKYLEGLGYKEVATGNAKTTDFEETEIAITDAKKAYLDLIIKDLSEKYTLAAETKTLEAGSKYDVVVTLGKK